MNNYHLTITTKTQGQLVVLTKYSEFGELVFVEIRELNARVGHVALAWIYGQIPHEESGIDELKKQPRVKVQLISTDLSFAAFWNLYDYKKGNRKRAENTWSKLDDATRIVALKKVKEYNFDMTKVSHGKVFPERWLAQERWENDYD